MPPAITKSEKITGEVRKSQLLTTYGCGALIDFPRFSGIMSGIDEWKKIDNLPESAKIHERNLEVMLGKDFFYQVFSGDGKIEDIFTLPTYRFPGWYYCPECHRLDHFYKLAKPETGGKSDYNKELICNKCSTKDHKVKLIPSRFVAACVNGHIDDFPYVWWAHRNKGICDSPKLLLEYKGTTGGLDSIHIKCENCGAEVTMSGCMNKDALQGLKCNGTMPWLGFERKHWYKDPDECHADMRCLQRSANNVYYSVNKSALTIPPWSERVQKIIASKNSFFEETFSEDSDEEIRRTLKKHFDKNSQVYGVDFETFVEAAYARYKGTKEVIDDKKLRQDEYIAFCGSDVDHEYFRTERIELPEPMRGYFKQVKLVKRLREVMVLQGFRRIFASGEDDPEKRKELGMSNNEFTPISRSPLNWLPAIELFGEGIFFELDEEFLREWESKNFERYLPMFEKHKKCNWIGRGMFDKNSPRYVLLHTLSHLMIRQLTAQCGYSTASIKEKIYSTFPDSDKTMCGFLIYTSATDTDGSLGGLVREGQPDRLKDTFMNMLQENSWCSNDPLCIESKCQGYEGLNYSACHACTLLPETSCEAMNCLLDRAAVVGLPDDKKVAFFEKLM